MRAAMKLLFVWAAHTHTHTVKTVPFGKSSTTSLGNALLLQPVQATSSKNNLHFVLEIHYYVLHQ